jgi:ankyrin repeat protein
LSGEKLKKAIGINEKDFYGKTALHYSAENGNYETTKILIETGSDVNQMDNEKSTALEIAITKQNKMIVEMLLKNKEVKMSSKASIKYEMMKVKEKSEYKTNFQREKYERISFYVIYYKEEVYESFQIFLKNNYETEYEKVLSYLNFLKYCLFENYEKMNEKFIFEIINSINNDDDDKIIINENLNEENNIIINDDENNVIINDENLNEEKIKNENSKKIKEIKEKLIKIILKKKYFSKYVKSPEYQKITEKEELKYFIKKYTTTYIHEIKEIKQEYYKYIKSINYEYFIDIIDEIDETNRNINNHTIEYFDEKFNNILNKFLLNKGKFVEFSFLDEEFIVNLIKKFKFDDNFKLKYDFNSLFSVVVDIVLRFLSGLGFLKFTSFQSYNDLILKYYFF